jgi:sugar/nucleoside kinase (ribokinase family)
VTLGTTDDSANAFRRNIHLAFSGGKGVNQAVAAARAGDKVVMICRVGNDAFGERLVNDLAASGVGSHEIRYVDDPSGVALIVTAASGENARGAGCGRVSTRLEGRSDGD